MRTKDAARAEGTPTLTEAAGCKRLPSPTASPYGSSHVRVLQAVARPSTAKSVVQVDTPSSRENTARKIQRLIKPTPTRAPPVPRAAAVNRSLDQELENVSGSSPAPDSSLVFDATPIPREKPVVEWTPADMPPEAAMTPTVQERVFCFSSFFIFRMQRVHMYLQEVDDTAPSPTVAGVSWHPFQTRYMSPRICRQAARSSRWGRRLPAQRRSQRRPLTPPCATRLRMRRPMAGQHPSSCMQRTYPELRLPRFAEL